MRRFIPIASVLLLPLLGAVVLAQTGEGMSSSGGNGEGHGYGYGRMGGWWVLYCIAKVSVVIFVLWLFLRVTRAVERIAGSK